MSQYRPHFFIKISDSDSREFDSDVSRGVVHEIAQRSITPTTLKSVTFFDSKDNMSFIENVSHKVSEKIAVLRTSAEEVKEASNILAKSQQHLAAAFKSGEFSKPSQEMPDMQRNLEAKIEMLANCSEEMRLYSEVLTKYPGSFLVYEDKYSTSSQDVTRFGINNSHENSSVFREALSIRAVLPQVSESKSSAKKSGKSSAKDDREVVKILHPLEILLINKALNFLYATDATTVTKTVLIDIFERQEDGSIILHDGLPGVHTVILYKLGVDDAMSASTVTTQTSIKQKLLVLDPSNSDFSKHLTSNIERICVGNDIRVEMDYLSNSSSKTLKIYAPPTKAPTGPNPDQYRDCTDIAVKIALGLNTLPCMASGQEVLKSHAIKMITNQPDVNEALFFESEVVARVRQASDDNVRVNAYKLLSILSKQCTSAELSDGLDVTKTATLFQEILGKSVAVFGNLYTSDQYGQCLVSAREICAENNTKIIGATEFDGGES